MFDRLHIKLSSYMPWAIVTDLDTGNKLDNITSITVGVDVDNLPVVTLTMRPADIEIETDGTVRPNLVFTQIPVKERQP